MLNNSNTHAPSRIQNREPDVRDIDKCPEERVHYLRKMNLLKECDLERANWEKRNIATHFVIIPIATGLCNQAEIFVRRYFVNRVQQKVFVDKTKAPARGRRKLHNEELL